jgi:hypothetical protein
MASLHQRLIGAVCLRAATYEDVEHDSSATLQAAGVVTLASITTSVGWYFGMASTRLIVFGAIRALVAWLVASAVLWFIGTRILPGKNTEADLGQLLRTLGFAQAPGLFGLLVVVPLVGLFVPFLVAMWVIAATFVAIRQALDYDDTFRAIMVCLLAWIVGVLVVYLTGFGATPLY